MVNVLKDMIINISLPSVVYFSALKMEAVISNYQITRRNIPSGSSLP